MKSALSRLENAATLIASCLLFAMMMIVVADVTLRYLFHAPLSWSYDLISIYLLGGVFFLGLPGSYRGGHHVNVDIAYQRFPPVLKRISDVVVLVLALIIFAVMEWRAAVRAWASWQSDESIPGVIEWPTWIPPALLVVGVSILLVRMVMNLMRLEDQPDHPANHEAEEGRN